MCVCCNVLLLMLMLVDYADLCIINVRVWRAEVYMVYGLLPLQTAATSPYPN